MLEQFGDPLAVFHIRLTPGHRLDVVRVDQQDLADPLEDVAHRLQIDPGRLHRQAWRPNSNDPHAAVTAGLPIAPGSRQQRSSSPVARRPIRKYIDTSDLHVYERVIGASEF